MNTARHVITLIGQGDFAEGVRRICEWRGLHAPAVYRWAVRGRIPSSHQGSIIRNARRMGIPLDPADFFDPADLVAVNDNAPSVHVVNNDEGGSGLPASPREKTS